MKKSIRNNLIIGILFTLATVILLVRGLVVTSHSIGDEAHMVATAYRFFLGDAPLVDDWSPEQLNGLVILPFLSLYVWMKGSTEGLFLFLRLVSLVLKAGIFWYGYIKLRDEDNFATILTALFIWYIFMPFNFDSLTYQVAPLIFLMLALIVIRAPKSNCFEYALIGVGYALSILSQPIWVISYPIILIYVLVNRKKVSIIKIIAFHAGILVIFAYFLLLVFSGATLREVLNNLPYIFSEPDHDVASAGIMGVFYENVIKVIGTIVWEHKLVTILNLAYILALVVFNEQKDRLKVLMLPIVLLSLGLITLKFSAYTMNYAFIAFTWMAVENLFFVNDKRYKYILILGGIYVISIALGTNVSLFSTPNGMSLLAFTTLFYYTIDEVSNLAIKLRKLLLPMLVIYTLIVRVFICYSDIMSPSQYQYKISDGPMKGLYAKEENYNRYYEIYNDIKALNIKYGDILFVGTEKPLAYLMAQTEFGTMGTPFFFLDGERLATYYVMHPNKIPSVLYD